MKQKFRIFWENCELSWRGMKRLLRGQDFIEVLEWIHEEQLKRGR